MISVKISYCTRRHEICEAAKKFYLNDENASKIFTLKSNLHNLRQRDLSITRSTTCLPITGYNSMCLRNLERAIQMMQNNPEKFWKEKEISNFS